MIPPSYRSRNVPIFLSLKFTVNRLQQILNRRLRYLAVRRAPGLRTARSGGTAEAPIGPHGVAAASTPACHGHRYMKWPRVPVPVPRREARRVRSRRCFPQAADIAEDAGHVWRCRTSLGSSLASWLTCSSEEQSCRVHCLGPQQSCRCRRSGR
jgi:hypothetical protein